MFRSLVGRSHPAAEYAGIHARTEEEWPDQFKYHYPKIFEGYAESCKVRGLFLMRWYLHPETNQGF